VPQSLADQARWRPLHRDQPDAESVEQRYRRVAIIWIVVAIGFVVFCVVAADWLFDFALGPDALVFVG
jgi:hypothetical protein